VRVVNRVWKRSTWILACEIQRAGRAATIENDAEGAGVCVFGKGIHITRIEKGLRENVNFMWLAVGIGRIFGRSTGFAGW